MPVDRGNYRPWEGSHTGVASRVLAIFKSDVRYKIKRPATIVIIVLIGLYTLVNALIPIFGNIFGGDNIFLENESPEYVDDIVPEIRIVSVDILDEELNITDSGKALASSFDISLKKNHIVRYSIVISNRGGDYGEINTILSPRSIFGSVDQWEYYLDGNKYNGVSHDRGGLHLGIIELDSKESTTIFLNIKLLNDSQPTCVSMELATEISGEKFDEDYDYYSIWDSYRSMILMTIRSEESNTSLVELGSLIDLEFIQLKAPVTGDIISDELAVFDNPPPAKWKDTIEFSYRIINNYQKDLQVYLEEMSYQPWVVTPLNGKNDPFILGSGRENSGEISISITPTTDDAPNVYYVIYRINLLEAVTRQSRPGKYYPDDISDEYEGEYEQGDDIVNSTYLVIPVKVVEKDLGTRDETGSFFFNAFFAGGVNIWVIIFGVILGSGMIADDKANKSLPLFHSKAIPKYGYALGKFITLTFLLMLVTGIWSIVWFSAIMIVGGFSWSFFTAHLWIIGALGLYGLIISLVMSGMVLALSSLTDNRYYVGASIISLFVILAIVGPLLRAITDNKYFSLVSISHNMRYVGLYIFDMTPPTLEWWWPALVLGSIFICTLLIIYRQLVVGRGDV